MSDPHLIPATHAEELLLAACGVLGAVVAFLYRETRRWQDLYHEEHKRRLRDLKQHSHDAERWFEALVKQRRKNSEGPPPPSS
jgi:hypothetical protein